MFFSDESPREVLMFFFVMIIPSWVFGSRLFHRLHYLLDWIHMGKNHIFLLQTTKHEKYWQTVVKHSAGSLSLRSSFEGASCFHETGTKQLWSGFKCSMTMI